ncbi:MAG: hypothetical protein WC477_00750 [Patescibacteria group bacterium]
MRSRTGSVAQLLFGDIAGSIIWFPVWWYTRGLNRVIRKAEDAISYRWRAYAFGIWLRNFFVPMYGQYDWTGRLISVFMRFFVMLGRLIALVVEIIVYFLGIVFWIFLPPVSLMLALQSGLLALIRPAGI